MGRPRKQPQPKPSLEDKLLEESLSFIESKKELSPIKPLTPRQYVASQAMTGLLARSTGLVRKEDLRREAYEWADFLLEWE